MIGTVKQLIPKMLNFDQEKKYEIKEYKESRNDKQNRKYWKLINSLSLTLGISTEKLHFEMLKNYSQRYEILVPSEQEIRGIEYFEKKSTIVKNGKEFHVYHVFTPSHELNTKEFAFLMKGVIEECKNVGVETLSPDEIAEYEAIIRGENS